MYVNRFNERYMGRSSTFLGVNPARDANAQISVLDRMATLRCRFAIAHSGPVRQLLSAVPGLQWTLDAGGLTVFRNDAMPPAPAQRVRLIQQGTAQVRVMVPDAGARHVLLPMAYGAQWRAMAGDKAVSLDEHDRLLRLSLPADWAGGEVLLQFGSGRARQLSLLVAVAGLGLSLSVATAVGWRRRRGAPMRQGSRTPDGDGIAPPG
jgi:hypothetical protein